MIAAITLLTAYVLSNGTGIGYPALNVVSGVADCINGAACGAYSPDYKVDGWNKLSLNTSATASAGVALYAAGYLEGVMTVQSMLDFYYNEVRSMYPGGDIPAAAMDFIHTQVAWMRTQSTLNPTDPFWIRVGLTLAQLDGIVAGAQSVNSQFTLDMALVLNYDGDIGDIPLTTGPNVQRVRDIITVDSRCSALFKIVGGEVYAAHATWDTYASMLRVLKSYTYNVAGLPPVTVSFSSSPGFIASIDDFYVTSQGLVVIETTIEYFNQSLAQYIVPQSVPCWMRNVVANWIAQTPSQWASTFEQYNSGTYNNQYMVLNVNSFPLPGSFVVLEQIPTLVVWQDMTSFILQQGYWASFNYPYFGEIISVGGFGADIDPRRLIIPAQQKNVIDAATMQNLIRYNNYKNDPLSLNNSCNAISARCDLTEKVAFGGIDGKVTSRAMANSMAFYAQNGPTHEYLAPFAWSNFTAPTIPAHVGQADLFSFDWIEFSGVSLVAKTDHK